MKGGIKVPQQHRHTWIPQVVYLSKLNGFFIQSPYLEQCLAIYKDLVTLLTSRESQNITSLTMSII